MSYRFPQMAVRCPWCKAGVGDLCTNPRGTVARRADTHDARRLAWAMTTRCAECHAPAGQSCTTEVQGQLVALPDVHPTRTPNPTTTP
ncbi:zinc finger domain-containing protein [Streptomyces griseoincarnatus]